MAEGLGNLGSRGSDSIDGLTGSSSQEWRNAPQVAASLEADLHLHLIANTTTMMLYKYSLATMTACNTRSTDTRLLFDGSHRSPSRYRLLA